MTKGNRSLEAIAAKINKLGHNHMFEVGKLLAEAHEQCEHGEWKAWVEANFDFSYHTARNYIAAYDLTVKVERINFSNVPPSIIYQMADLDKHANEEARYEGHEEEIAESKERAAAVFKEMEAAAKLGRVSVAEGKSILHFAGWRRRWGKLPEVTLQALFDVETPGTGRYVKDEDLRGSIQAALKRRKPESDDAAQAVYTEALREHYNHKQEEADRDYEAAAEERKEWLESTAEPDDTAAAEQDDDTGQDDHTEQEDAAAEQGDDTEEGRMPAALGVDLMNVLDGFRNNPMPKRLRIVTREQIAELVNYLETLLESLDKRSMVQRAADRAEARSRNTRH